MLGDQPFRAKHGQTETEWARCVAPLNMLPEFCAGLTPKAARSEYYFFSCSIITDSLSTKFREFLDEHDKLDRAQMAESGGGDVIYDETVQVLDELSSLVKDHKDNKQHEKAETDEKESDLVKQGSVLRQNAMTTLGKRAKPGFNFSK